MGLPTSFEQAIGALPVPQPRAWGTLAFDPGRRAPVLILSPPHVPVVATWSEARFGLRPILAWSDLVSPINLRTLAGGGVGLAGSGVAAAEIGGGWSSLIVFTMTAIGGIAAETFGRLRHRARVIPVPREGMDLICAIEHASAVARLHWGDKEYDSEVVNGLRQMLWIESEANPDLTGALLPLARLYRAIRERNHAVLGPHRIPYWYPDTSVEPAGWPVASRTAQELVEGVIIRLEVESALERPESPEK